MWAGSLELRDAPGGSGPERRDAPEPAPDGAFDPELEREAVLVCASCRAFITATRDRLEIGGAHSHAFVNPAGVIYRIRCFSAAPGAIGTGEESDYWSWFPGFLWQTAVCSSCLEHLGWRFRNAASVFFGLITERVLELEEPGPDSN